MSEQASDAAFSDYARYYDLFYRDKDYAGEATWVDGRLRRAGLTGGRLIDLGCGTGGHVRPLVRHGWKVTGVDPSASMLAMARERDPAGAATYVESDGESFDVGRDFDAVVSLFHVASYHASPGAFTRMLANVRRHLRQNGVLIFDFWHGGGVLRDPPVERRRELISDDLELTRIARPRHFPDQRLIEVTYDLRIIEGITGEERRLCETHRMRYFILPEVETALTETGFQILATTGGLVEEPLHDGSWYGLVVASAQ